MGDQPLRRHSPHAELLPEAYRYLLEFRQRYSADDVLSLLQSVSGGRVLVVGEAIIDEYDYVEPMGKSAKDAVLASRHLYDEAQAGGAIAIANHLAAFADRVDLVTALGDRDRREDFVRAHLRPNVHPTFITKSDSPTTVKRRIVDSYSNTKLLELYDFDDQPLTPDDEAAFCRALEGSLPLADLAVVADFGHGVLTDRAVQTVQRGARFLAVNVQTNAANLGFNTVSKYSRADFVSIQEREIRLDRRDRVGPLPDLIRDLNQTLGARTTLVTRGKLGTLLYSQDKVVGCPSLATHVVDRLGAGDAVFALSSLLARASVPPDALSFLSNAVGAVAVTVVGNRRPIDRNDLEAYIRFLLTEVGE